jgi:hypothetical protein
VLNIAGGRPSLGSAPSAASRLFPCHICSIPIHHYIFVLRAGVVLHRRFSSIGGLSCHIDDQWTTPPLSPSHQQWAYSVCLCCLCLFIFWYEPESYVHTCGSTRYTQMVLDSVFTRRIYIHFVVCNMIISVLFDNVYILTAYNGGKYMYHLL